MNQENQDIRWKQRFNNFEKALIQLNDAVSLNKKRELSNLEQQGVVKAFEFMQELSWKVLKDFLENEGIINIIGSKGAVRESFNKGLIKDGDIFMDMIEKRNLSSHTYNQELATLLVKDICNKYHKSFLDLQKTLKSKL